jgi:hypothetical protein
MWSPNESEALDDWEFYKDHDGRWLWRNVTKEREVFGADRFVSFVEVIASAIQHGCEPGVSRITVRGDRRRKPRSPPRGTRTPV